jgi:hypothetical protein
VVAGEAHICATPNVGVAGFSTRPERHFDLRPVRRFKLAKLTGTPTGDDG